MENKIIEISENELSKVRDKSLNSDQLSFLFAKTPQKHIYKRPAKGGGEWKFVTGVYVKKVLNLMFGWDWDFEVIKEIINIEAKQVIILGKLTCRCNGKAIIKMQYGRSDVKFKKGTTEPLDLGNDMKAATTDALKKCASELGIASDVYSPNEFVEINVIPEPIDSIEQQADSKEKNRIETHINNAKTIQELTSISLKVVIHHGLKQEYENKLNELSKKK